MKELIRLVRETEGQDLVEYALLAATLALGTLTAVQVVRDSILVHYGNIQSAIAGGS